MSRKAWGIFAALSIIWGMPYLLIKISVVEFSPAQIVFLRAFIAAVILLPIVWRQRSLPRLKKVWFWVLLFAVLEISGPFWLISAAEERVTSSLAAIMIATVPMIGAFAAWSFRLDDRVTPLRLFGLAVGFIGVGVLVGLDVRGGTWVAIGQLLLAAIGYALAPLVIAAKLSEVSSEAVLAVALVFNAILFAPLALAGFSPTSISGEAWGAVIVLAVLCTAIALLLLFRLIAEAGPSRTVVITYFNPVVAVILGVVFLSEPITIGVLIGFPMVLLGSVLATRRAPLVEDLPHP